MSEPSETYSKNIWDYVFPALIWERGQLGIAKISLDGHWLAANPRICELLEYTESELQSRDLYQVTHPEDVDFDRTMMDQLALGKIDHYVMSKRYITKTQRVIWIKHRIDPVVDPDTSALVCYMSQVQDATELPRRVTDSLVPRPKELKDDSSIDVFKKNWKIFLPITLTAVGGILSMWLRFETLVMDYREIKENNKTIKSQIQDLQESNRVILATLEELKSK